MNLGRTEQVIRTAKRNEVSPCPEDVDARGFIVACETWICRDDYDDFGDCCTGGRDEVKNNY